MADTIITFGAWTVSRNAEGKLKLLSVKVPPPPSSSEPEPQEPKALEAYPMVTDRSLLTEWKMEDDHIWRDEEDEDYKPSAHHRKKMIEPRYKYQPYRDCKIVFSRTAAEIRNIQYLMYPSFIPGEESRFHFSPLTQLKLEIKHGEVTIPK